MTFKQFVETLQKTMNQQGEKLIVDGIVGPNTKDALSRFKIDVLMLKRIETDDETTPDTEIPPSYPRSHEFHPVFDVPAPYTHLHPIDVLRSVSGEKEIPGSRDNPLIAHFHEHSGNLGSHSDHNDYSDEVPHCSSALNWCADMSGCRKTNSALAASWSEYGNVRQGDWIEEGDIIHLRQGSQNHVTMANKRFNRRTSRNFEGFGSNQGNMIKTSSYPVSAIKSVQKWAPLPGTKLAPIGILGHKPTPVSGGKNEGTI